MNIPSDAVYRNGHFYKAYEDKKVSWHTAKANCEAVGGHLAVSLSSADNDFLHSLCQDKSVCYWLGGTDEDVEGTWVWITGDPWSYENWTPSWQPDNAGGTEHYLHICGNYGGTDDGGSVTTHYWNDAADNHIGYYICMWEPNLYPHTLNNPIGTFAQPVQTNNNGVSVVYGARTKPQPCGFYYFPIPEGSTNIRFFATPACTNGCVATLQVFRPSGRMLTGTPLSAAAGRKTHLRTWNGSNIWGYVAQATASPDTRADATIKAVLDTQFGSVFSGFSFDDSQANDGSGSVVPYSSALQTFNVDGEEIRWTGDQLDGWPGSAMDPFDNVASMSAAADWTKYDSLADTLDYKPEGQIVNKLEIDLIWDDIVVVVIGSCNYVFYGSWTDGPDLTDLTCGSPGFNWLWKKWKRNNLK